VAKCAISFLYLLHKCGFADGRNGTCRALVQAPGAGPPSLFPSFLALRATDPHCSNSSSGFCTVCASQVSPAFELCLSSSVPISYFDSLTCPENSTVFHMRFTCSLLKSSLTPRPHPLTGSFLYPSLLIRDAFFSSSLLLYLLPLSASVSACAPIHFTPRRRMPSPLVVSHLPFLRGLLSRYFPVVEPLVLSRHLVAPLRPCLPPLHPPVSFLVFC